MSKFNIGDKVRIKPFREGYRAQPPAFTRHMEHLCGREFVVEEFRVNYVKYEDYVWHDDWLEPIEDIEEEAEEDIDAVDFESIIYSFKKG